MAKTDMIRVKLGGKLHEVDPDDLTLDELVALEDITGQGFGDIDYSSARALKGLAFVVLRRADPKFSIEQVGELKVGAFEDPDQVEKPKRPTRQKATA